MSQGIKEPQSVEDEVKALKGLSWFDIEEEHRKVSCRKSLTRIVFVSLLDPAIEKKSSHTAFEIASKIFDFFSVFLKDGEGYKDGKGSIHGGVVLAVEGTEDQTEAVATLGFLEVGSSRFAQKILSQLCDNKDNKSAMHSIRVLLVSDDCPCNEFESFGVYIARTPAETSAVDVMKEGPTIVFKNIMKKLCRRCKSFTSEPERRGNVKVLSGLNRKALPSAIRIVSCARCDAYPTIKEYMDIFHSPIYFELDSERSYPLLPVIDWRQVERMASSLSQESFK